MFLILFLLLLVMVGEMTSGRMAGVVKNKLTTKYDIDWRDYEYYIDTYCSNPKVPYMRNIDVLAKKYPAVRTQMLQVYFDVDELPGEIEDHIDYLADTDSNVSFEENVDDIKTKYNLHHLMDWTARDAELMEELFEEASEQEAAEYIYQQARGAMQGLPAESVMPRVMDYILQGMSKREALDASKQLVDTLAGVMARYKLKDSDRLTAKKLKEIADTTVDIALAEAAGEPDEPEPIMEGDTMEFDEEAIKQAAMEERKRQSEWRVQESERKREDKTFWEKIEEEKPKKEKEQPPTKEYCKLCHEYHFVGSDIWKQHQAELERKRKELIAKQQQEYQQAMKPPKEKEEEIEVTDDDISKMLEEEDEPESIEDLVKQKKQLEEKEGKRTSIPPEHPFIDTRHGGKIPEKILSGLKIVFRAKNTQKVLDIINKITGLHYTEDAAFQFESGGGEGRYLPFDLVRIKGTLEWRPVTKGPHGEFLTKEGHHLLEDVVEALEDANLAKADTTTGSGVLTTTEPDLLGVMRKHIEGYIDYEIEYEDIRFISESRERWERDHEFPSQEEQQHRQEEIDRLKDKLKGLD